MTEDVVARLRDRLVWESRVLVAEGIARWALAGAAVGIALAVVSALTGANTSARWAAAVIPGLTACLVGYRRATHIWTPAAVAEALEKRHPADNLVVTAEALGPAHPWLPRVAAAAWSRVESAAPASARPAWMRAALAMGVMTAAAIGPLPGAGVAARPGSEAGADRPAAPPRLALTVVVTSPAYLGGEAVEYPDATAVDVVAGGQVMLRATTAARAIHVSRDGAPPLVAPASDGLAVIELPSPSGRTRPVTAAGAAGGAHLVIVRVVADAAPVRVTEPARDRRVATPVADLAVRLEASDDHALSDLLLRYTRVSGGGESLTFVDRDVPARRTRPAHGAWTAAAVVTLARSASRTATWWSTAGWPAYAARRGGGRVGGLHRRDRRVTRGIGGGRRRRRRRPGGATGDQSADGDRQDRATPREPRALNDRRGLREAQAMAIEQRMVRAEFVFMTGGEVQDETSRRPRRPPTWRRDVRRTKVNPRSSTPRARCHGPKPGSPPATPRRRSWPSVRRCASCSRPSTVAGSCCGPLPSVRESIRHDGSRARRHRGRRRPCR